ncbi:MAG: PQQ-binding-like beta-propeller repeat protein [Pseudomonadota bacterium]
MKRTASIKAASLLVMALILAAGCAGKKRHPSYRWSQGKLEGRKVLKDQWYRPLVLNFERSYNPYEGGSLLADPETGRIYVGTSAGRFYALGSGDGRLIWRFHSGDAIHSTPTLDHEANIVYFGNDAGRLYALNAGSGREIFQYEAGGEIRSRPVLHGRALFFKDIRGKVHAIDARNGKGLWIFQWEPPEGYIVESTASVAIHGDTVLAGFSNGTAVGINLIEGSEKWRTDLSEFVPSQIEMELASSKIDVNTTPVVLGDEILFSSFRGGLFSLDPEDGAILWRRSDLSMISGLNVDGDEIYVSITNKGVARLSRDTGGETVWLSEFPCKAVSPVAVYKDLIVVTDSYYGLLVLSRETGQVFDRFTPMWGSSAPAFVKSERILIHSNGGSVYSFLIR